MQVEPSSKNIFAKPIKGENQTKSGFLLSEKSIEDPQLAEVISIGKEVTQFQVGDRIIYKPYTTTDIKLEDESYFLIEEADVLGIIKNV